METIRRQWWIAAVTSMSSSAMSIRNHTYLPTKSKGFFSIKESGDRDERVCKYVRAYVCTVTCGGARFCSNTLPKQYRMSVGHLTREVQRPYISSKSTRKLSLNK